MNKQLNSAVKKKRTATKMFTCTITRQVFGIRQSFFDPGLGGFELVRHLVSGETCTLWSLSPPIITIPTDLPMDSMFKLLLCDLAKLYWLKCVQFVVAVLAGCFKKQPAHCLFATPGLVPKNTRRQCALVKKTPSGDVFYDVSQVADIFACFVFFYLHLFWELCCVKEQETQLS